MRTNRIVLLFVITILAGISGKLFAYGIDDMIETYKNVNSYSALLRSSGIDGENHIQFFYQKPGYIKMQFIKPHSGAQVIYNPFTQKVTVRPFKYMKFVSLDLDPSSDLITDPKGHTVDESDLGALLKNVKLLSQNGSTVIIGHERLDENDCMILAIKGNENHTVEGIGSYQIWVDRNINLPVRVESYDLAEKHIETVFIDELKVNVDYPAGFFDN